MSRESLRSSYIASELRKMQEAVDYRNRLRDAAPELLAMLEKVAREMAEVHDEEDWDTLADARALIARVKGTP